MCGIEKKGKPLKVSVICILYLLISYSAISLVLMANFKSKQFFDTAFFLLFAPVTVFFVQMATYFNVKSNKVRLDPKTCENGLSVWKKIPNNQDERKTLSCIVRRSSCLEDVLKKNIVAIMCFSLCMFILYFVHQCMYVM